MKQIIFILLIFCNLVQGQNYGSLRGQLIEAYTQEPIKFAQLSLQINGALVAQTRANKEGGFMFPNIDGGNYDLVICKLGLSPLKIINVLIAPNEHIEFNPVFEAGGFDQDTVVFTYAEFQDDIRKKNSQKLKCIRKRQQQSARRLEKHAMN